MSHMLPFGRICQRVAAGTIDAIAAAPRAGNCNYTADGFGRHYSAQLGPGRDIYTGLYFVVTRARTAQMSMCTVLVRESVHEHQAQ
jgi:hypothetical protein